MDGYAFKIGSDGELEGWRFDFGRFKYDQEYYKNISPIDTRNKSPFTNGYYWIKLKNL